MHNLIWIYLFIGWSWAMHGNGYTLGMIMHSNDRPPYTPLYAFTMRIVEETLLWPFQLYTIISRRLK